MALLTSSQVHIDQPLTNLTIAYMQSDESFIADKVFPQVPVSKKTDRYYIYDRAHFNRIGNVQPRAPRTEAPRIGMTISTDSYSIDVFSLAADFSFELMANEDTALNVKEAQAKVLASQLLIDRERKWAATYFAPSVWATEYTGISGAPTLPQVRQWNDYTNSTPIQDMTRALRAMQLRSGGFRPNVMVVGREVRDVLINHPDILNRLNGGATVVNTALVTDAKLAEIFGVSKFLVMDSVQNTAAEGVAESNSFIGGKFAALYYTPPAPGLMVPSAGYIFTWNELQNASGYGMDVRTYTGDFLTVQAIAEVLEVNMAYDQKVVGADLGVFFNTIIA